MKESVLQRINEILKLKASGNESKFAKIIGANQKTINQQLRGERSLSLDTVLLVISSFEDISTEWLIRGEGEMIKSEKSIPKRLNAEVEIGEDGSVKLIIK